MQKLSLVSILMLIALAGVGFFIVAVYNPFNSNANNLQSPILNSNNPQPGVSTSVTTVTSVTTASTSSATASSTSGNSPSGGVSLLTGSPSNNTSTSSGGDDGGSDS